jgi:uncharacterized protein YraI
MNIWKQLPNATKIYLVLLVYLVVLLCGLIVFRQTKNSSEVFSLKGIFSRENQVASLTQTIETGPQVTTTLQFSENAAWLRAKTNVQIFDGPGEGFTGIAWLEDDQTAAVVGVNEDKTWWVVEVPYFAEGRGWVPNELVEVNNGENVPIVGADMGKPVGSSEAEDFPIAKAIANINIRSGPDLRYQKIGTLEIDQTAKILGASADNYWFLIVVPGTDDIQGWISRDYVIAQNEDKIPVVGSDPGFQSTLQPGSAFLTSTATVNVRAGPSLTFAVIGQLNEGQIAEIVGKTEDGIWWAIKFPGADNQRGWVAAAYVNAQNTADVPVIK